MACIPSSNFWANVNKYKRQYNSLIDTAQGYYHNEVPALWANLFIRHLLPINSHNFPVPWETLHIATTRKLFQHLQMSCEQEVNTLKIIHFIIYINM